MKKKVGIHGIVIAFMVICCFKAVTQDTGGQESDYADIAVEITEKENGMAIVTGKGEPGNIFQFALNYPPEDIVLKNISFIDFTGDNEKELCLQLNIWNSISPDLNSIIVYGIKNNKMLFPTSDKSFIFNGYIGQFKDNGVERNIIIYKSYTKLNDNLIEDESSINIWKNDSFEILEYQNKLLVETDEYLVFCKKDFSYVDSFYELVILNPKTLEIIQKLELTMDEASITKRIQEQELVKRINAESYNLIIEGYRIQNWDQTLGRFK